MVEVERDFWRPCSPTICSNRVPCNILPWTVSRGLLNIFREADFTTCQDNLFCHPHGKKLFPHVQLEQLLLQFVPIAAHPIDGHHQKRSGPITLTPAIQKLIHLYTYISRGKIPSILLACLKADSYENERKQRILEKIH